jgi:cobalt/nickel transport system ATP-binding protein
MTPRPLVEVRGLRHRYDDGTLALDGVDFLLFPGETVALFGPNGSGKTTFAHHLNGLLTGEGFVSVCGLSLEKKNLAEIRRKVGMVFQESDEQLFMSTVIEDVAFGPLNLGRTPEQAVAEAMRALDRVGMQQAAGKAPYHLSAGEKKRVALAGVLAMDPEILILDEPTTSLDPPAQRSLAAMLRNLPQSKILITHDAPFARALSTRAVFFEKGREVAAGPVAEIIERFHWDLSASAAQECARR